MSAKRLITHAVLTVAVMAVVSRVPQVRALVNNTPA